MNIFPKFQKILRALCFYFGIWFKILRKYIVCTLGAQAELGREKISKITEITEISEISLEPEILRKPFLPWEIKKYNFFVPVSMSAVDHVWTDQENNIQ